jgi:hypothetical protein
MNFLHSDLGVLPASSIVVVELDKAANVKLLDEVNFSAYQRGQRHHFFGGQAKRSPVRLAVPESRHWHLALDLGGVSGNIRYSIQVVRPR